MQARTLLDSVITARVNSPTRQVSGASLRCRSSQRGTAQRAGAKLPFGEKLRLRDEGILLDLAAHARLCRIAHVVGRSFGWFRQTPEAIAEFEAAVKVDPHAPNVNFGLGYLYWKLRRYEQGPQRLRMKLRRSAKRPSAAYLGDLN